MKQKLRFLWRQHKALFLAFSLAALVTVFFLIRAVVFFVYWSDPAHRNLPLEAWMTPRYIAYSYDLPLEDVGELLGIEAGAEFRPPLESIARKQGVPVSDLMDRITQQLASRQAIKP